VSVIGKLVAVRYQDGRVVKGFTADFHPQRPLFHLRETNSAPIRNVRVAELKAVFFIRTPGGNPKHHERRISPSNDSRARDLVQFKDGEGWRAGRLPSPPPALASHRRPIRSPTWSAPTWFGPRWRGPARRGGGSARSDTRRGLRRSRPPQPVARLYTPAEVQPASLSRGTEGLRASASARLLHAGFSAAGLSKPAKSRRHRGRPGRRAPRRRLGRPRRPPRRTSPLDSPFPPLVLCPSLFGRKTSPTPFGGGGLRVRTHVTKGAECIHDWHVIDADGIVLGRLACEAANLLRGKHKPIFTHHLDTVDHVIIVNADKVVLSTGNRYKERRRLRLPGRHGRPYKQDRGSPGGRPQGGPWHCRRAAWAVRSSRRSRSTAGPSTRARAQRQEAPHGRAAHAAGRE
jgi:hypothetical protein